MKCSSSTLAPIEFANSSTSRWSHETGTGGYVWPAPGFFCCCAMVVCVKETA